MERQPKFDILLSMGGGTITGARELMQDRENNRREREIEEEWR